MIEKSLTSPFIALITVNPMNTSIVGTMFGKKLTFHFMREKGFEAWYAKLDFPGGAKAFAFHFENMN